MGPLVLKPYLNINTLSLENGFKSFWFSHFLNSAIFSSFFSLNGWQLWKSQWIPNLFKEISYRDIGPILQKLHE